MRGLLIFLIFLPLLVLGGTFNWVARQQPKKAEAVVELPSLGTPPESKDAKVQKGWQVYTTKGCVYCHGPNAAGGVAHNNAQGGLIPALNKVYEGFSHEELEDKILKGVPVAAKADSKGPTPPLYMPAWKGHLSADELDAVVAYLMSFKPAGGGGEEW